MKHIIVLILLAILPLHEIRAQYNTNRLIISGQSALYYEDYVISTKLLLQSLISTSLGFIADLQSSISTTIRALRLT